MTLALTVITALLSVSCSVSRKAVSEHVEKRDSVMVQNTGLTNPTEKKKSGFLTYVKWIFALVCAVIVLILVIRFGRRGLL